VTGLQRAGRWIGDHLVMAAGALVLVYMFVPIAVVMLMSFNDNSKSRNVYAFRDFTWNNWANPCRPDGMCAAVVRSIEIGLLATLVATLLGTLAAFALVRHDFIGRSVANTVIFLPMASPEIVLGASLLTMFISIGLRSGIVPPGLTLLPKETLALGFSTILIAHVMFNISYVVVTVKARLTGFDRRLEEAAMDLGANEWTTFWRVTFPLILPGVLAAAMLAFSLSIDDFVITNFVSGTTNTFPIWTYGVIRNALPAQINVIGSVVFLTAVGFVAITTLRTGRAIRTH
jgi:spermidine/putrescine transport system permease protein